MAANPSEQISPLTEILQSSIDDLRSLVLCRICIRPMYEPYTTQCGHTFCYSCLRQWFDRHTKKSCPDCRAHVLHQPAPAYLVREMTQIFINTTALLAVGETTIDHAVAQREEALLVEKDRTSQDRRGGLFNGRFKPVVRSLAPIRDGPDGVERCPMCTWEIEDGMCNSCGYTVLDADLDGRGYVSDSESEEDLESFHSDVQSFSSSQLEEILADHPDHLDHDSTGSGNDRPGRRRRFMQHIRQRAGLPLSRHVRQPRLPSSLSPSSPYLDSEGDDLSDESEGSIRDFMVDDIPSPASGHFSDPTITDDVVEHTSHASSSSESSEAEEDSDSTAVNTATRRPPMRPLALPSPSDADDSDSDGSSHVPCQRNAGSFSPLQDNSEDDGSQHVPIQVDSDSDIPPIRRRTRARHRPTAASLTSSSEDDSDPPPVAHVRRNRPTAASFITPSSDDDDARGVNISDSPPQEPNRRERVDASPSHTHSPIVVASSPTRPTANRSISSPRLLSPPHHSRRQRSTPSPRQTAEERRQRKRQKRLRLRELRGQQESSFHGPSASSGPQLAYIGA